MAQKDLPEGHLDVLFLHGAYPLWLYLQQVLGINIVDVCSRVAKTEPLLQTRFGTLAARLVSSFNKTKLSPTFNNDVVFLINSINVVFNSLKPGMERDGKNLLGDFRFDKDAYNNIYLVNNKTNLPISDIAIAVVKIDDTGHENKQTPDEKEKNAS